MHSCKAASPNWDGYVVDVIREGFTFGDPWSSSISSVLVPLLRSTLEKGYAASALNVWQVGHLSAFQWSLRAFFVATLQKITEDSMGSVLQPMTFVGNPMFRWGDGWIAWTALDGKASLSLLWSWWFSLSPECSRNKKKAQPGRYENIIRNERLGDSGLNSFCWVIEYDSIW